MVLGSFGGIGANQEDSILSAVIEAFESRGYKPYKEDYSNFSSPTLSDIFEVYKENLEGKKDAPYSLMHRLVSCSPLSADNHPS